jgi:hypothetical protein
MGRRPKALEGRQTNLGLSKRHSELSTMEDLLLKSVANRRYMAYIDLARSLFGARVPWLSLNIQTKKGLRP